jgi:hypothetical protein
MNKIYLLFLAALPQLVCANAERIVLVEIDGLSPQALKSGDCPTLAGIAARGVLFANHHGSFPASESAAIAELSTGGAPGANGILADKQYLPKVDVRESVEIGYAPTIRCADTASFDRFLLLPTLPEVLRSVTPPLSSLTASADGNILLADRKVRAHNSPSTLLAGGATLPGAAVGRLKSLGVFPPLTGGSAAARDEWTVAAVTKVFWEESVPVFTYLRLAEPSASQRLHGADSPEAAEALSAADARVSELLFALREKDLLATTDVIVVSGLPPVRPLTTLAEKLRAAALPVVHEFGSEVPEGSILALEGAGHALLYVKGHDAETIAKIAGVLHTLPCAAFTTEGACGTLTLKDAGLDVPEAPDFLVTFVNEKAAANRTLMAAMGPDFKKGLTSQRASGNADLAPTLLWILGIDAPKGTTGRILSEALTIPAPQPPQEEPVTLTPAADNGAGFFLTGTRAGSALYVDEAGSATQPAK